MYTIQDPLQPDTLLRFEDYQTPNLQDPYDETVPVARYVQRSIRVQDLKTADAIADEKIDEGCLKVDIEVPRENDGYLVTFYEID